MEQDQQQPSQQTPPIAMAPPPVQPVEPIQPVQPVPPLPSQQELQSAIDLDRRRQRIKTARVLCAIAALLNLIGAVATATLYALTASNHVVTLIVATLLPVVASFFGLSAVGKSRVASSISFFGISIAAVWYFLFGIVILFSPLDSRPDWLMTLLLILDMIALIGGIVVFIMGILSGIFCALAKRAGKRKGIVQLVFVCVILAAAIGVTVYALGFEGYAEDGSTDSGTYSVGDTWTVDVEWSLTITGVTETERRDPLATDEEHVYIIDYTYTNLGHKDKTTGGLYMSIYTEFTSDTLTDSHGQSGGMSLLDVGNGPEDIPVGSTCEAQDAICLENAGDFTLEIRRFDNDGNGHSATFTLSPTGYESAESADSDPTQHILNSVIQSDDITDYTPGADYTQAQFQRIAIGMTYDEVVQILDGDPGFFVTGFNTYVSVYWCDPDFDYVFVSFTDGIVTEIS